MSRAIIKYPLITEKTARKQAEGNQYSFVVDTDANKLSIRQAVESLKKGIEVESVKTILVRGKVKRMGRSVGKRSNWKKAVVRLKAGQTLELVENA